MTDSEQTPEPEPEVTEPEVTEPEQPEQPQVFEVTPAEGETYAAAYQRALKEAAGISDEPETVEPLGVLTGQVPVNSMPIAYGNAVVSPPGFTLDGEVLDETSE